jgi:hypothetical protein
MDNEQIPNLVRLVEEGTDGPALKPHGLARGDWFVVLLSLFAFELLMRWELDVLLVVLVVA